MGFVIFDLETKLKFITLLKAPEYVTTCLYQHMFPPTTAYPYKYCGILQYFIPACMMRE